MKKDYPLQMLMAHPKYRFHGKYNDIEWLRENYMKTLLIDAEKRIDCRNCQTACKDEHCDNDWSPIAALQAPRQYWIKVNNTEAGDGARVEMQRTQVVCQQCADAPCMKVAARVVRCAPFGMLSTATLFRPSNTCRSFSGRCQSPQSCLAATDTRASRSPFARKCF